MIEIKLSPVFRKDLKRLSKKYRSLLNEVGQLIDELETNPYLGTDLGDNVRKMTDTEAVVSMDEGHLTLLTLYDKSERETLTDAEIKELLRLSRYYK